MTTWKVEVRTGNTSPGFLEIESGNAMQADYVMRRMIEAPTPYIKLKNGMMIPKSDITGFNIMRKYDS